MPSFQTVFRAVVMVAVGAAAVKGWRLYGPTNEQVKSAVAQAVEVVQSAIQSRQQATTAVPDPRVAPIAVAPGIVPPAAPLVQAEAPKLLPDSGAMPAVETASPPLAGDRMPELMTRLQKLGAADTNLAPWGSGGNLYRFSCRAPLANAPAMTQHFESVAAEPEVAVEQVVAKVEAWRVAQRDGGTLRY
jgi:hypothetical protein